MRTKLLTTFILLTAAYLVTAKPKKKQPESQHNCQCTNNHSPVCGCQILPNTVVDRNYQMQCSCTPPGPTKCVCHDASQNQKTTKKVKTLRDMSPYPALSVSVPMTSASSSNGCSDVCQSSCVASCSHLQTSSKCGDICASACVFSCSRNEKPGTTVAEYKFIVPSPEKTTTLIPIATSAPVLRQPPVYVVEPAPPVLVPMPVQKVCDSDCMPECSITCTYLKPALKLLKGFLDKDTSSSQCLSTCTDSCKKICTGVSTVECKDNCAPVCSETCSLTVSKPQKCTSLCLPACDPQCIQLSIQIEQSIHPQLVRSVPVPPPPAVTPLLPATISIPLPPPPVTHVAAAPKTAKALCSNECSVQCEHQCNVQSLSGPSCLAACQTTCYPVCQARLRRKHRTFKKEAIEEEEEARNADNVSEEREEERR